MPEPEIKPGATVSASGKGGLVEGGFENLCFFALHFFCYFHFEMFVRPPWNSGQGLLD